MLSRLLRHGLLFGILGMFVAACGSTYVGTQTAAPGASATPATANPTATSAAPTATPQPVSGGTATPATAINCGQVFQSPDGSVAPPAPNYAGITGCFTSAFGTCQPAFLEFIAQSSNSTRDLTFTALSVKGTCQVYVADRVQATNGTETHNFYYCAHAAQSSAKAILTGCDTHYTNGTLSIPA